MIDGEEPRYYLIKGAYTTLDLAFIIINETAPAPGQNLDVTI